MNVRVIERAQRQAERIDRWWRANRKAAPDQFAQEFFAARQRIAEMPEFGRPYAVRKGVVVRRLLVGGTKNYVYYEIDHVHDEAIILAVWGAPRGKGPKL